MTKTIAQTYTIAHTYRRSITSILLAACIVCALFYVAHIYSMVSHSVAIQQATESVVAADAAIQRLDTQYIALTASITPDMLHTYGFDTAAVSAFISRTTSLGLAQGGYGI